MGLCFRGNEAVSRRKNRFFFGQNLQDQPRMFEWCGLGLEARKIPGKSGRITRGLSLSPEIRDDGIPVPSLQHMRKWEGGGWLPDLVALNFRCGIEFVFNYGFISTVIGHYSVAAVLRSGELARKKHTVLSRGVGSLFGPTRKSSPWGIFSDGGLNQSIKRGLSS